MIYIQLLNLQRRENIRKKYGISGGIADDVTAVCFFGTCAMIQEYHEVHGTDCAAQPQMSINVPAPATVAQKKATTDASGGGGGGGGGEKEALAESNAPVKSESEEKKATSEVVATGEKEAVAESTAPVKSEPDEQTEKQ